jgi:prevent-host-death family protein
MTLKASLSQAKGQLTELVKRAESGEDVVLTRFGRDVVRLVPVTRKPTAEERRAALDTAQLEGRLKALPGPSAARSQDFLYDEEGLPR